MEPGYTLLISSQLLGFFITETRALQTSRLVFLVLTASSIEWGFQHQPQGCVVTSPERGAGRKCLVGWQPVKCTGTSWAPDVPIRSRGSSPLVALPAGSFSVPLRIPQVQRCTPHPCEAPFKPASAAASPSASALCLLVTFTFPRPDCASEPGAGMPFALSPPCRVESLWLSPRSPSQESSLQPLIPLFLGDF